MTTARLFAATLGLALHLGAHAADFTVSSTDIAPGQTLAPAQVFQGFGCTGGNLAPQLSWHGAPAGTKSYAVTLYDPDAPTGSGWWHWSVFNLPASTTSLPGGATAGTLPAGAMQGRNDFGDSAYAALARHPATRRTAIRSRSGPWAWTSCPWINRPAAPCSATCSTPTRWARHS